MRVKLVAWMLLLVVIGAGAGWALFNVKPPAKPDCSKSIELFSQYLGLGTIASERGQDITKYKQDMLAVIRNNQACFPETLVALTR